MKWKNAPNTLINTRFSVTMCAEGGSRTLTSEETRPWNVRVYQFRHFSICHLLLNAPKHIYHPDRYQNGCFNLCDRVRAPIESLWKILRVTGYLPEDSGQGTSVPKVGIEPTLPKEHDFESCASTNSATSAKDFIRQSNDAISAKAEKACKHI